MADIEKLKTALRSRNITIKQAAEHIGINPSTFYRKMNRECGTFTVAEVGKLAELLNMDSGTMRSIFFDR